MVLALAGDSTTTSFLPEPVAEAVGVFGEDALADCLAVFFMILVIGGADCCVDNVLGLSAAHDVCMLGTFVKPAGTFSESIEGEFTEKPKNRMGGKGRRDGEKTALSPKSLMGPAGWHACRLAHRLAGDDDPLDVD